MRGGIEGEDLTLTIKEILKYSLKYKYLILITRKKYSILLVVSKPPQEFCFRIVMPMIFNMMLRLDEDVKNHTSCPYE